MTVPYNNSSGLPLRASLLSIFLCILFGANAVAMKISLAGLGAFTTAGLRFSVAALTITLWAVLTGKPLVLKKGKVRPLIILGFVFFVQLSLFYLGMVRTMASHGTLIANVLPFVVMILAHVFIPGDRITLRKFSGLVVGFTGVMVLFADSSSYSSDIAVGDFCVLAAVLIWGGNAVYTKKIISGYHPIQVALYPMVVSSPLFFLCGLCWDEPMVSFVNFEVVLGLLYQTFVTASFGMVAWVTLIRKYGATSLHAFVYIMPLSGVLLGVTMLGEPVTKNLVVSAVLVVAGLIIINRNSSSDRS